MGVNESPDRALAALAAGNDGVFTRRQALSAGLSAKQIRTRCATGAWEEVYPRTFRVAGAPLTDRLRLRAALAFAGAGSVLARRTAGVSWGLDGVVAHKPEILVPYARHPRHPAVVVIRTMRLERDDTTLRSGLPVTTVARTIVDLAAVLDDEGIENVIQSARRLRLTSIDAVATKLASLDGPGRSGAGRLRRVLQHLDGRAPSESPLEVKVARALRSTDLRPPVAQHCVSTPQGVFRVDFAWPAERVALECDGRAYHGDFDADRRRWSSLASAGWRIVFATWREASRDPGVVVARVRAALDASSTSR